MMEMKKVLVATQRTIPLGYQGENNARQVVFVESGPLLGENWTLFHQRAFDKEPYPVPLDVTDQGLIWTVTSGDTEFNGSGRAQLICTGTNGEVLKNAIYNTNVAKSLHVGGEPPDPVKPWYDDIMQKLEQGGGGTVKSVNGIEPDENGNVEVDGVSVEELETALAGKANAQHTHSIADIEEVETTTSRTTLGECTTVASSPKQLFGDFTDIEKWNALNEGQKVILTVGDEEYDGTYVGFTEIPSLLAEAGPYRIQYLILDASSRISPAPEAGTTIKLEVVETKSVIPEHYLPDMDRASTVYYNSDMLYMDSDATEPCYIGALIDLMNKGIVNIDGGTFMSVAIYVNYQNGEVLFYDPTTATFRTVTAS